jgi:hypothetical protein
MGEIDKLQLKIARDLQREEAKGRVIGPTSVDRGRQIYQQKPSK